MKRATFPLLSLLVPGVLALGAAAPLALSVPLTLAQQAQKAEVIVRAVPGQPKSVKAGDVNYLAYPLEVKETIAGDVKSLPQQDGKPALLLLDGLEDAPKITLGQEMFLLLYTQRLDSPVVGVNQGAYGVQNGKVEAKVDALKADTATITEPAKLTEAIRAARGNK
ncbi:hypothetical protein [Deinococcus cavernae]|uniref:hypothetical protein n=1 Tax=Deinococcus cavernae TaxID=2320857 RepID=UPI001F2DD0D0|nr:hypothetical protein [Deinococcus cavernae]